MINKYTIEDMKRIAQDRGGECLSDTYVNNKIKLKWKCKLGHTWDSAPSNIINSKHWCPICAGMVIITINDMKSLAIDRGGICLSKEYKNARSKLRWRCKEGHEWEASPDSIKVRGSWCPYCSNRKISTDNSLQCLCPELASEWHPAKNGNLTPDNVVPGSNRIVWWKCDKGPDHEWRTSVANRFKGSSCPFCINRKVSVTNSLSTVYPDIASEWHPTKNGNLTPNDVVAGSGKRAWWKCKNGHEWLSRLDHRMNGSGCPYCVNLKVDLSNCLATTHPDLANEWHPTKNGNLTPYTVVAGSGKKAWWKCNKGPDHEWKATIVFRTTGSRCPFCSTKKLSITNNLKVMYPELAKQWHPTKNENLTPDKIVSISQKAVWWKCDKGPDHEWKNKIIYRVKSPGCPFCLRKYPSITNCLATTHPEIAKEWHPIKNGNLTPFDVLAGSTRMVWWKCNKGPDHEWKAPPYSRLQGRGCAVCFGKVVVKSNCLATLYPELSKDWHPTKNENLTPYHVMPGSGKVVWWKCNKGPDHEWRSSIANRVKGNGCSVCDGKTVVNSNCIETTHPNLAAEWHQTKNGDLTPNQVIAGSSKKVWWKCSIGPDHEWAATINNRSKGVGCPFCILKFQSRTELSILFELKYIYEKIDPRGGKISVDDQVLNIDIYLPEKKLCIEFDGSYYHKDRLSQDIHKTTKLLKNGYKVIRLREHPLKKINSDDIIIHNSRDVKNIVNMILHAILDKTYVADSEKEFINEYMIKKDLQNVYRYEKYLYNLLRKRYLNSSKINKKTILC